MFESRAQLHETLQAVVSRRASWDDVMDCCVAQGDDATLQQAIIDAEGTSQPWFTDESVVALLGMCLPREALEPPTDFVGSAAPQRGACIDLLARRFPHLRLVDARPNSAPRMYWKRLTDDIDHEMAAEIWGAMLEEELVPHTWSEHPLRRFWTHVLCGVCSGEKRASTVDGSQPCPSCDGRGAVVAGIRSTPPTVRGCLTFAADPLGVEHAELLAWLTHHRLAVWNADWVDWRYSTHPPRQPPEQVCWRVVSRRFDRVQIARSTRYLNVAAMDAVARAVRPAGRGRLPDHRQQHGEFSGLPRNAHTFHGALSSPTLLQAIESEWSAHHAWRALAEVGANVPQNGMNRPLPSGLQACGQSFAALENPFAPLCAISARGYVLEAFEPGMLCMVAPWIR